MPAHHRVGCGDRQVLTPASTPAASEDPEQLVPGAKPSTWPGASRTGKDGELVAQQQVLKHEVLTWARPGQHGREDKPEEFKHVLSIADPTARPTFCRLTGPHAGSRASSPGEQAAACDYRKNS